MEYFAETDYERLLVTHYNNKPNHLGDADIERYYSEVQIMKHYEENWEHYAFPEQPDAMDYNKYAYMQLWQERDRIRRDSENQLKLKEIFKANAENLPFYFVTINYPKELSDVQKLKEITTNISKLEWVESIEDYVYEYYTQNGGHPHCHMLIIAREKMPPSKVADKIFAVRGLGKLLSGKQYVDVAKNRDKTKEWYRNYINGLKKDSKRENCELDKEWRIENNLE